MFPSLQTLVSALNLPCLGGSVHAPLRLSEHPDAVSLCHRAITLQNQLVILAATPGDSGAYYAQAVNERNGENKTSPLVALSVPSECETLSGCLGSGVRLP